MRTTLKPGTQVGDVYQCMIDLIRTNTPVLIPNITGINGSILTEKQLKRSVLKVAPKYFPGQSFRVRSCAPGRFMLSFANTKKPLFSSAAAISSSAKDSSEKYLWSAMKWAAKRLSEVDAFDLSVFESEQIEVQKADKFIRSSVTKELSHVAFYAYVTSYGWLRIGAIKKSR